MYGVVFDIDDTILKLPHPYPYPPERSPYRLRNSDSAINHVASPPLDKSNQKYIEGPCQMSSTDSGVTKGTAMEKAQGTRTSEPSLDSVKSMSSTRVFFLSTIPSIITLALLHILRSRSNPFRIPLFDDSPLLINGGNHIGIRWDAIHFTAIASRGYEYEQQLAFQPGWQGVLWLAGRVWRLVIGGDPLDSISVGGTILVVLLAGWRGLALYK